ncbi:hypothetical protein [European catfish virus]|uniref:Uncharacterized protein n=1 Tax=European catfish virus TaxID=84739 RepID=I2BFR5_9VIRU|nr:hypothetical protein A190_gp085 [European catfish virus]AFJ52368.1 hypothetical protein [European catfish virus]AMZ04914.1 hypothetical protein [European catfish virus]AMZ05050.1 hypothetical protein [European catfish virus]
MWVQISLYSLKIKTVLGLKMWVQISLYSLKIKTVLGLKMWVPTFTLDAIFTSLRRYK